MKLYNCLKLGGTVHFTLKFKANVVFVMGDSGTGKTFLFQQLAKYALIHPDKRIRCYDNAIISSGATLESMLRMVTNSFIVIDNADIIVPMPLRQYISCDTNNQYLIFCHTTNGYYPAMNSLTDLSIEGNKGQLIYLYDELNDKLNRRRTAQI